MQITRQRRPETSTPFVYRKTPENETAADTILSIARPMLKSNLRKKVEILLQSLSRVVRHALFDRFDIDVSGPVDDRSECLVEKLMQAIEKPV